ncbi:hypothetical protein Vretimale_5719 [Volvox reticuliferus]|uniref:glycerophosphodiester phosphodiesterase n=1 Tax=Volvox reticuliferus TaxID=1737510 RepID=A0A8J4G668_9CHLO|nr:hypothetical protein Vretimale_5719 [Volvox reticuliferus]
MRVICIVANVALLLLGLLLKTCMQGVQAISAAECILPVDGSPFVMAYRGASADFPEHSIGAYRAAIEQGAQFIECDVVLSQDLVPLCRHEPNIAHTTNVLVARHKLQGDGSSGDEDRSPEGSVVWASDLTLAEIKQLRAVFPEGAVTAVTAGERDNQHQHENCVSRYIVSSIVESDSEECKAPWASHSRRDTPASEREAAGGAVSADDEIHGLADLRVATLEDLLQMATATEPAVGVAVHIQAASWHNIILGVQLKAQNATFEDLLLHLLQRYGYAMDPYGSEAWRRRPSYVMAFEAGSLRYLSQRTSSPLTQVIGPMIPDTGESWESATSPEGLARIRSYAGSVAVARQELLQLWQPTSVHDLQVASGGGRHRIMASDLLLRMRRAGLQVFASVFKPSPREHLLPQAETWVDEISALVFGRGLRQGHDGGEGGADGMEPGASVRRPGAAIDGLFTDSPEELHAVLKGLRCSSTGGSTGNQGQDSIALL